MCSPGFLLDMTSVSVIILLFQSYILIPHEVLSPLHVCMSILLVDDQQLFLSFSVVLVDHIMNGCENSNGRWRHVQRDWHRELTKNIK